MIGKWVIRGGLERARREREERDRERERKRERQRRIREREKSIYARARDGGTACGMEKSAETASVETLTKSGSTRGICNQAKSSLFFLLLILQGG